MIDETRCRDRIFTAVNAPRNRADMDQVIAEFRDKSRQWGESEAVHSLVHSFLDAEHPSILAVTSAALVRELAHRTETSLEDVE